MYSETKRHLRTVWTDMRRRCQDPKRTCYRTYGGRGITVCAEWDISFIAFYDWAIASGYQSGLTIERRNNDLGYSPDNCTWANSTQQARNLRRNHNITAWGETKCATDWANDPRARFKRYGIAHRARSGMSPEEAIAGERRIGGVPIGHKFLNANWAPMEITRRLGSANGRSKLTDEQVREIRALYGNGGHNSTYFE